MQFYYIVQGDSKRDDFATMDMIKGMGDGM